MLPRLDVHVRRGALLESRHRIAAVACDAAGAPVAATAGDDPPTSFRSAAKPFQLLPLVERGHAARWGWTDEELALMAASHSGSEWHVERVARMLERLGLGPGDLACAFHEPFDPEAAEGLRDHPERRSALYNNCSGKHAGMLCLALSEGWPIEGYALAGHPVQRLMRDTVAQVCGRAPESLATAVDGCGVVAFGVPLSAMALAYARLAAARADGDARERALARIRDAMRGHPVAVAGRGRFGTALMEASGGRLVSKVGAEALECVAVPDRGWGVAVKVEDGGARAAGPAVTALLERLGVLTAEEARGLASHARPVVRNHAGLEVGLLEAVWSEDGAS